MALRKLRKKIFDLHFTNSMRPTNYMFTKENNNKARKARKHIGLNYDSEIHDDISTRDCRVL